jgi:hypothetical protein
MTKVHDISYGETRSQKEHRRGKDSSGPRRTYAEKYPERSIVKVPADSVPYGTDVSRNGRDVWAVFDYGELLCIAPTAKEARRKAYDAKARLDAARRVAEGQPQHIDTTGVAQEIPLKC